MLKGIVCIKKKLIAVYHPAAGGVVYGYRGWNLFII